MCEQLGIEIEPKYVDPRPGDIRHSLADTSNAEKYIGYDPDWCFKDGFVEAVNWYKENI